MNGLVQPKNDPERLLLMSRNPKHEAFQRRFSQTGSNGGHPWDGPRAVTIWFRLMGYSMPQSCHLMVNICEDEVLAFNMFENQGIWVYPVQRGQAMEGCDPHTTVIVDDLFQALPAMPSCSGASSARMARAGGGVDDPCWAFAKDCHLDIQLSAGPFLYHLVMTNIAMENPL